MSCVEYSSFVPKTNVYKSENERRALIMHSILPEIGIAILAATALGFIFQLCRQPVILGYLVAGALIGPEIGRAHV